MKSVRFYSVSFCGFNDHTISLKFWIMSLVSTDISSNLLLLGLSLPHWSFLEPIKINQILGESVVCGNVNDVLRDLSGQS